MDGVGMEMVLRKEPTVEIWDKGRKEWVIKES